MDYKKFEKDFLADLANNNSDCLKKINEFQDLIEKTFDENPEKINEFVNEINSIILDTKNDFNLIESVLRHDSFKNILSAFRKSDILIKASKSENEEIINLALALEVDTCVQDCNGMTALMYAAKNEKLFFLVEKLLNNNDASIKIEDKNGETALFYSIYNMDSLDKFTSCKSVNINHLNKNHENVLLYCCKYDILKPLKILCFLNIDANVVNNDCKTAAMYLVENGRYHEFQILAGGNTDLEYKNEKGETVLNILIKKINEQNNTKDPNTISPFMKILMILVQMDCNFNVSIDDQGNTPLMFFIMIRDFNSINYIMSFNRKLNVSLKNKEGDSAFSLSQKIGNRELAVRIMKHKSFNFDYLDKYNNSLLMNYVCIGKVNLIAEVLKKRYSLLNEVNNNKESPLIIAVKLNKKDVVKYLISQPKINLDQQDINGNTAIHYSVLDRNTDFTNILALKGANINLKNNDNKSPLDIAYDMKNTILINTLKHPLPLLEDKNKEDKIKKLKNKKLLFPFKNSKKKEKSKNTNDNNSKEDNNTFNSSYKNIIRFEVNDNPMIYKPLQPYNQINTVVQKNL